MPTLFPLQLPDWPRAGGAPRGRGRLRVQPEDFRVDEQSDIALAGEGEHDWLHIEKRGANTAWVARQLARHAGVPVRDVGYAGLKDRHALTTQWFSVLRPAGRACDWTTLARPGVRVLVLGRHARKLRRGAHRGNAFLIRVREFAGEPDEALARIRAGGVPNYFGEQRFGRDGANLELAEALLGGRRLRRDARSLALSAARSFLFNEVLARRVTDGSWQRLLPGDVALLAGSRSRFSVEAVDDALAARCREQDLHPSGPLWGRMQEPAAQSAPEREVLAQHAQLAAALEPLADADRRALRLVVEDLEWNAAPGELTLSFRLAPGAFATAVLREILSPRAPQ